MEGNNIKSFENLCKIFEMRIKLDKEKNIDTPKEVLENYEKYAKKIDNIYNEEFQKELRTLISPAKDIEKEKKRLEALVSIVEKRLDKRTDLEQRYYDTTGEYILSFQPIVSDKELDDRKERLDNITRYLDNNNEINSITESINELSKSLSDEENKKEKYKDKNKVLEEELYSEFTKVKNADDSYENIDSENIDSEIADIIPLADEYKETLDVTKDSINSLLNNGIDEDYNSYVEEANKAYYTIKNKELFLKMYKLVLDTKEDFNDIFIKREQLSDLIMERKNLLKELGVSDINVLSKFESMVSEQVKIIDKEKETLDNISNYNSKIDFKKSRLQQLKEDNEDSEILSILEEFGLIETYDNEEFAEPEVKIELPENKIEIEEINPYRIKEVIDAPKTLNIGLARLKGETIRERVNRKLNPPVENSVEPSADSSVGVPAISTENTETPANKETPLSDNSTDQSANNADNSIPAWDINPTEKVSANDVEPIPANVNSNEQTMNSDVNSIPVWGINPIEQASANDVEPIPTNVNSNEQTMNSDANSIPVWDINPTGQAFANDVESIPTNVNSNEQTMNSDVNSIPVWDINPTGQVVGDGVPMTTTSNVSTIPVQDVHNNVSNVAFSQAVENSNMAPINDSVPTAFWVPLSEEKLENGVMPDVDLTTYQSNGSVAN